MTDKPVTACRCRLVQFANREDCRKCGRLLPRVKPERSRIVIFRSTLPTATECLDELILEAIRRTDSIKAAAKLINLGKTTVYRRVKTLPVILGG